MFNVKNLVLGLGIIVVFALVLWQGIEAFYPSPQWDDFCGDRDKARIPVSLEKEEPITETECIADGGEWRNGYCDYYAECQREYDSAREAHSQVVFFVSLLVGVLALFFGYSILSIEPVGSALIASGIWSFFWGTAINWTNISSIWRFLLLLAALVLIIWIAIRYNQTKKKSLLKALFLKNN